MDENLKNEYVKKIENKVNIKGYYFLEDSELKYGHLINSKIKKINKKYDNQLPELKGRNKTDILKQQLNDQIKITNDEELKEILTYIEIRNFLIESKIKLNAFESIRKKIFELIPSTAKISIFADTQIFYKHNDVELHVINDMSDFNKLILDLPKNIYFRGQQNLNWENKPSIFRKSNWINHEKEMIEEMLRKLPDDFSDCKTTIERLTKMQHYQLPTRLLDLTENSLVALYFACEQSTEKNNSNKAWGEITFYSSERTKISNFSDVSTTVLSNLSLMNKDFSLTELKQKIFQDGLTVDDTDINMYKKKNIYILPKMNNQRIKNQSGLFLLFGMGEDKTSPADLSDAYYKVENKKIVFLIKEKKLLLKQLDTLSKINKGFIYPDIDDYAMYLKNEKYGEESN